MKWVLVIYLSSGHGPMLTVNKFKTLKACEKVKAEVALALSKRRGYTSKHLACLPIEEL